MHLVYVLVTQRTLALLPVALHHAQVDSIGPAALDISWVGAGSADCFFHAGIHCWDMAAGVQLGNATGVPPSDKLT